VSEQARRISHCRLTFFINSGRDEVFKHGAFVEGAIHFSELDDQPSLWKDRVRLDEGFYRALLEHPVPLSESALKAIGPRSLVIDVYIWLAYRLHALKRSVEIGWPALASQFGGGAQAIRQFRAYFLEALELALAAYPDARVALGERGLILHPSRPAIARA
jgi:Plasmid encoded RepA protein